MGYKEYEFEWVDENEVRKRLIVATEDKSFAWHKALQACGWDNRTSLGLIGDNLAMGIKNGPIVNWFDIMNTMHSDPELKNFMLSISHGQRLSLVVTAPSANQRVSSHGL